MSKVVILGSGSACGVPTISDGWGKCDAGNEKNRRSRAGVYVEIGQNKLLFDTSADLRNQLISNGIKLVDAVFYTHVHADHVMGIDDLRALNYSIRQLFDSEETDVAHALNIYATEEHINELRHRFDYVMADEEERETTHHPCLQPYIITYMQDIYIGAIKVTPLAFTGHPVPTTGYAINDGQVVIVPDYKIIPPQTLDYLQKIDVNVLIMPLTDVKEIHYHAGMDIDLDYIRIIKPQRAILTHLGPACDYETVKKMCPTGVEPAFDNMVIEL